ncbi:hypothetical protein ISS08_00940 [Candidatus Pacearchaeota archaeon]|nr:hypothetical protein [Candidatus Pacearchaeota archaeon]
MSNKDILHIKFEYDELIKSKRDLLSTEISLLKIVKAIKNYQFFREDELKTKITLLRKAKLVKSDLKKLEMTFPKVKETDHFIEDKPTPIGEPSIKKKKAERKAPSDYNLESQLADIQNKLSSLSA